VKFARVERIMSARAPPRGRDGYGRLQGMGWVMAATHNGSPKDCHFSQAVLDAPDARVAVLDARGTIVAINPAWARFAAENGPAAAPGVGVNYPAVCGPATGTDAAADGVRAVLAGSAPQFALEYPYPAPDRPRWFEMRVTALHPAPPGLAAVVLHTDVTGRKEGEAEQGRAAELLRAVADGTTDAVFVKDRRRRRR
jgi:PAS domain-containing protein